MADKFTRFLDKIDQGPYWRNYLIVTIFLMLVAALMALND